PVVPCRIAAPGGRNAWTPRGAGRRWGPPTGQMTGRRGPPGVATAPAGSGGSRAGARGRRGGRHRVARAAAAGDALLLGAEPVELVAVADHLEAAEPVGDAVLQPLDLLVLELEDEAALGADEVRSEERRVGDRGEAGWGGERGR